MWNVQHRVLENMTIVICINLKDFHIVQTQNVELPATIDAQKVK